MTAHHSIRTSRHLSNQPPLPRAIQEHLANQLRLAYRQLEDRPAYLGDPALPLAFDEPLYRLAVRESSRERAKQKGLVAVRSALIRTARGACATFTRARGLTQAEWQAAR